MIQARTKFLTTASAAAHFPPTTQPEIAFLGRSNVGKSSLVNTLLGAGTARVSSTPGRTQTIQFFEVSMLPPADAPDLIVADPPGYGYARASKKDRADWRVLMDDYLNGRPNLGLCLVLVDATLPPQDSDRNVLIYLHDLGRRVLLVATKADKLPATRRAAAVRDLGKALGAEIVACSGRTGDGREDLWRKVLGILGIRLRKKT